MFLTDLFLAISSLLGWAILITEFEGPFDILNILRDSLVPIKRLPIPDVMNKDAINTFNTNEVARNNLINSVAFTITFAGTLHTILSCRFCIIPYLSLGYLCFYTWLPVVLVYIHLTGISFILMKILSRWL